MNSVLGFFYVRFFVVGFEMKKLDNLGSQKEGDRLSSKPSGTGSSVRQKTSGSEHSITEDYRHKKFSLRRANLQTSHLDPKEDITNPKTSPRPPRPGSKGRPSPKLSPRTSRPGSKENSPKLSPRPLRPGSRGRPSPKTSPRTSRPGSKENSSPKTSPRTSRPGSKENSSPKLSPRTSRPGSKENSSPNMPRPDSRERRVQRSRAENPGSLYSSTLDTTPIYPDTHLYSELFHPLVHPLIASGDFPQMASTILRNYNPQAAAQNLPGGSRESRMILGPMSPNRHPRVPAITFDSQRPGPSTASDFWPLASGSGPSTSGLSSQVSERDIIVIDDSSGDSNKRTDVPAITFDSQIARPGPSTASDSWPIASGSGPSTSGLGSQVSERDIIVIDDSSDDSDAAQRADLERRLTYASDRNTNQGMSFTSHLDQSGNFGPGYASGDHQNVQKIVPLRPIPVRMPYASNAPPTVLTIYPHMAGSIFLCEGRRPRKTKREFQVKGRPYGDKYLIRGIDEVHGFNVDILFPVGVEFHKYNVDAPGYDVSTFFLREGGLRMTASGRRTIAVFDRGIVRQRPMPQTIGNRNVFFSIFRNMDDAVSPITMVPGPSNIRPDILTLAHPTTDVNVYELPDHSQKGAFRVFTPTGDINHGDLMVYDLRTNREQSTVAAKILDRPRRFRIKTTKDEIIFRGQAL